MSLTPQQELVAATAGIHVLSRRVRRAGDRRARRKGMLLLTMLLLLAGFVHGWGMKGAPLYQHDEGTYVSEAWAVATQGTLSHYTYWYDHPPAGWLQVAGYALLTNGFGRSTDPIGMAREFMLILQIASCALLYLLARRLSIGRPFAALAVLLFALSPLAVWFHRQVLLDNIATPWVLAAFVLALSPNRRLIAHAASGACFALAVLTKETSLLLLPALVWQLWQVSDRRTRRYSMAVFSGTFLALCSTYLLYAALKNEFFEGPGHVSLLWAVKWQIFERSGSGSILDPTSAKRGLVRLWLGFDLWLPLLTLAVVPIALFVRRLRPVALSALLFVVMLARPGYVPYPFIIGLLPFGALVIAGLVDLVWGTQRSVRTWTRPSSAFRRATAVLLVGILLVGAGPSWVRKDRSLSTADTDAPARSAQHWIAQHIPTDATMLVDNVFWIDLVLRGRPRPSVVWFWKLDLDPEVSRRFPHGWRDFDYVVVTIYVKIGLHDLGRNARQAVDNSDLVAAFGSGVERVEIRRVTPPRR